MRILVDEMREGLDERLKAHGFDCESARKLFLKGVKIHTDYSIMKYAERHRMVLITEDEDNIDGCLENGIDYVKYGQKSSFEFLIKELEIIKEKRIRKKPAKIRDVRSGIVSCLNNGKRLLDDARTLQESKRYHSAIPLYVLGYEELGKAIFLFEKWMKGSDVYESEFRAIAGGRGAHLAKILEDFNKFGNFLESLSDEEYAARQKAAESLGINFPTVDRQMALKLHNQTLKVIEKLHDVKMAFLYVGYSRGKWLTQIEFSEKMLDSVCEYLYYEMLRPYYQLNYGLIRYSMKEPEGAPLTQEQLQTLLESGYPQQIHDLGQFYKSKEFIENYKLARAVIESVEMENDATF